MKCKIRGEKIKVTSAIQEYVETKLSKLDKYIKDENVVASVLIKVKGKDQAIEVTIPYDKYTLRSEERRDDLYAAIDLVSDKLERQIRKNKTRLNRNVKDTAREFNFDYVLEDTEEESKEKIVKRKNIEMKPMDEEEAMLELELLGHGFFVYKDMHSGSVNVIYKRKDGNYGIIETN